ncbi:Caspase-9 [Araneus ventricosus]|uniref:Caspase-9 n=1 Tax=Araneus ventricosus TaxID=182803 RepID=A0A4Y2GY43_ARAVE|nr:Caspase-9 [Araneus ventricosus]
MDPASRNIILRNKDYLSERIDLYKLRPFLKKHDIFTYLMLDDIYNFPTEYDFYVELTTRGPDALDKFRQVLRDAGYSQEASIFETNSSNIRDPDAIDKFRPVLRETGYSQGANIGGTNSSNIVGKRMCYKMNSKPFLGYCFIINNVKFKRHSYRYGSDVDAQALDRLFTNIGYKVEIESNLEASEMIAYLKKFSKQDWSAVDSCVLFILSHGNNSQNLDIIFGSDSEFVKLIDIYKIFDNENCQPLKFKPKMFFFSACRGDEVDYGVWTTVSSDAAKIVKVSAMTDMFIVHSTLPNHESYRDHEKGTWFCQDLIEVFSSDYLTQDLDTMLQTVDRKLESRLSEEMSKQVLHIDHFGVKATVYLSMEKVVDICEIYDPQKSLAS